MGGDAGGLDSAPVDLYKTRTPFCMLTRIHTVQGSRAFEYVRPRSVSAAVDFLSSPDALALAGGTDVVPLRASGVLSPKVMVDLKHIGALQSSDRDSGIVRLGACRRMIDVAQLPDGGAEALVEGAAIVGAPQTRRRATLGGNVCRSSPAGDTLAPLLVLGARARIAGPKGERTVLVESFFTGPGANVLGPGELLVGIEFATTPGCGSAYQRLTYRRTMDLAVVGVAASVRVENGICVSARVAACAVAPTPILVPDAANELISTDAGSDVLRRVCDAVIASARPITDVRGTAAYRIQVLAPLTDRVVRRAFSRALRAGPVAP